MIPTEQPVQPAVPAPDGNRKMLLLTLFSVGMLVLLLALFYLSRSFATSLEQPIPPPPSSSELEQTRADSRQGLGDALYEAAANPVSDALPETPAPVANPIDGAYKNPFE